MVRSRPPRRPAPAVATGGDGGAGSGEARHGRGCGRRSGRTDPLRRSGLARVAHPRTWSRSRRPRAPDSWLHRRHRRGTARVRFSMSRASLKTLPPAPSPCPSAQTLVEALAGRRVALTSVSRPTSSPSIPSALRRSRSREVVVTAKGVVRPGSSRALLDPRTAGAGFAPRAWAHLLGTVFQGEAKKARLELAPLRHDPVPGAPFSPAVSSCASTSWARRRASSRWAGPGGVVVRWTALSTARRRGGARGQGRRPLPGSVRGRLWPRPPGVDARSLGLSRLGQAVAYHLVPDRALFGPGSSLFFLSEGEKLNPLGDAVYELRLGQAASRMNVASGAPWGPRPPSTSRP